MSTFVAPSIPSRPGDEFTSMINGPRLEGNMSTPATPKPIFFAASIAAWFSCLLSLTTVATPPL